MQIDSQSKILPHLIIYQLANATQEATESPKLADSVTSAGRRVHWEIPMTSRAILASGRFEFALSAAFNTVRPFFMSPALA